MGLWSKITGEFIDVIEWTDDSGHTLVYRFPRYNNEIKNGARLTVREGQVAAFIDEGRLADVFEPGMYTLDTENLPILATLRGWKHGFESPFKAEVYFVSTRVFTDQKWGTKNPVMMRDAEFGPVRVRAFGSYTLRVSDPSTFIKEIVGTDAQFTTEEVTDQVRNVLVARFSDALAESGIPVLDMAANYDELGAKLDGRVRIDLEGYGLELGTLLVENISLPQSVEEALDRRTSLGVVGDMDGYTRYQAATAIGDAAKNPGGGGLAAGGLGAGIGLAMGSQMGQMLGQGQGAASPPDAEPRAEEQGDRSATPPPLPREPQYFVAVDGRQTGPFRMDEIEARVKDGRLVRETLVWAQGMTEWARAEDVEAVARLFGTVPPPLPPR